MSNEKATVTVEEAIVALDHVWSGPDWLPDDIRKAYASSYGKRHGFKIPSGVVIALHGITTILTQRGDFSGLTGLWEPQGILRRAATRENGAPYLTVRATEVVLEQIRQTPTTTGPERNTQLDGEDEEIHPQSALDYAQDPDIYSDSLGSKGSPMRESIDMEASPIEASEVADEAGARENKLSPSHSPFFYDPQPLHHSPSFAGLSDDDAAAPPQAGNSSQPDDAPFTPFHDTSAGRSHKRKRVMSEDAHDAFVQDTGLLAMIQHGDSTLRVTKNAPTPATGVEASPGREVQEDMSSDIPFHTLLARTPLSYLREKQFLAQTFERDAEDDVYSLEDRLFEYRVKKGVEERLASSMEKLEQTLYTRPDASRISQLETLSSNSVTNQRVSLADSLSHEAKTQFLLEGAQLLLQKTVPEHGSSDYTLAEIQEQLADARKKLEDVRVAMNTRQQIMVKRQYHEKAQQAFIEGFGVDEETARAENWFELLA